MAYLRASSPTSVATCLAKSSTRSNPLQKTDEREVWRLVVDFPDGPMNFAVARDYALIELDREATDSLLGNIAKPRLERLTANTHDCAAWMSFVKEMVDLLRKPITDECVEAAFHEMNEVRQRYLLAADVADEELRDLEMGVRETLRITGQLEIDRSARKYRGFGK